MGDESSEEGMTIKLSPNTVRTSKNVELLYDYIFLHPDHFMWKYAKKYQIRDYNTWMPIISSNVIRGFDHASFGKASFLQIQYSGYVDKNGRKRISRCEGGD